MSKTTSFILGNHFEEFVTSQVQGGRYASASEVIRDGLRLVEERTQALTALKAQLVLTVALRRTSAGMQFAAEAVQTREQAPCS